MNKRLGRLGMLLSVYGSCLPTLNGSGGRTFYYDRTKYKGDKELAEILKEKAKQRRKNKRRRKKCQKSSMKSASLSFVYVEL